MNMDLVGILGPSENSKDENRYPMRLNKSMGLEYISVDDLYCCLNGSIDNGHESIMKCQGN